MKIQLYNRTYEVKKTSKPDEVIDLLIDALSSNNAQKDPVAVLSMVKDQYLHSLVPSYVNLRVALSDIEVKQKELADVLCMTPQDVNRRFSGVTKWKPLEKRAIVQFFADRGIEYTEEQLFAE